MLNFKPKQKITFDTEAKQTFASLAIEHKHKKQKQKKRKIFSKKQSQLTVGRRNERKETEKNGRVFSRAFTF